LPDTLVNFNTNKTIWCELKGAKERMWTMEKERGRDERMLTKTNKN
jgi:hypothetical protein